MNYSPSLYLRNHGWGGIERRSRPRHATPYKLASNWRTSTMTMLMLGTVLPMRNPIVLALMLLGVFAAVLFAPRPMKAVIPNDCADPNIPWWRWIAEGCYLLTKKVTLRGEA